MAGGGAPLGNKNASRAGELRALIKDAFARKARARGLIRDNAVLEELVDQFIDDAFTDKEVRKDLFDRLFGKAPQALSMDGDGEGGPILQRIERVLVRAVAQDPDSGSI